MVIYEPSGCLDGTEDLVPPATPSVCHLSMRGTFLLAFALLGSYVLIKAEISLFYLLPTWNPSLLLCLCPAFKLHYVSGFLSMPSYDYILLCFAAISLSFLAKGAGCLCDTKHQTVSVWVLASSLFTASALLFHLVLHWALQTSSVHLCHLWLVVSFAFCAVLSSSMCKYSLVGCLLFSVILSLFHSCLYTYFNMAFTVFSL